MFLLSATWTKFVSVTNTGQLLFNSILWPQMALILCLAKRYPWHDFPLIKSLRELTFPWRDKKSFEPDLNQRPMDIWDQNWINYSPPLYQLSYRRCMKVEVFIVSYDQPLANDLCWETGLPGSFPMCLIKYSVRMLYVIHWGRSSDGRALA